MEERTEKQQRKQKDQFLTNFQLELDKKKRELAIGNNNKAIPTAPSDPEQLSDDDENQLISDDSLEDEDNVLSLDLSNTLSISTNDKIERPQIPDRSTKPNLSDDFGRDQLCELIVPFKSITEKFSNLSRANTSKTICDVSKFQITLLYLCLFQIAT